MNEKFMIRSAALSTFLFGKNNKKYYTDSFSDVLYRLTQVFGDGFYLSKDWKKDRKNIYLKYNKSKCGHIVKFSDIHDYDIKESI